MLLRLTELLINGYFACVPRSKPQLNEINQAKIIAHRGAHNNAQGLFENTLEAFRAAQKAGCWGIEFDVHVTADDVFMVLHDPCLNRLWGHNVRVADLSFAQLRAIEPGIPSLAEVVAEFGHSMHLFIELKIPFENEETLRRTLEPLAACKEYHLLALDEAIFECVTSFPHEALLLVPIHNNMKQFCDLSIKQNYGGVLGSYLLLTNRKAKQLVHANKITGVGFVDSKFSLYRELNRGFSWIFTNKAETVALYLRQLRQT